uniref:Secreted protein n=1 Tax=Ixodes ricinus TaxID=34613 RepID=A0A6B0TV95_IXORI
MVRCLSWCCCPGCCCWWFCRGCSGGGGGSLKPDLGLERDRDRAHRLLCLHQGAASERSGSKRGPLAAVVVVGGARPLP